MACKKMPVSRKLKREVIKLAQQPGASVEWIAHDLGISVYLLERWIQAAMTTHLASAVKKDTVSSEES